METAVTFPPKPQFLMSPSIAFRQVQPLLLRLTPAPFRLFASASATASPTLEPEILTTSEPSSSKKSRSNGSRVSVKKVVIDAQQLKLNRLESISYPRSESDGTPAPEDSGPANADSRRVVGVDPDISGALAVLKPDNSAQVYDSPQLRVLVGKSVRKRLDVKSIIQSTTTPTPTTIEPEIITIPEPSSSKKSRSNGSGVRVKKAVIDAQQFKLSRLESLSYPSSENDGTPAPEDSGPANADSRWVVGVDPDISGALAVLKPDNSAQVYDSPQLRVLVGKSVRKCLDVKSIIQSTTPTTIEPEIITIPEPSSSKKSRSNGSGVRVKKAVIDAQQFKLSRLESLSYPSSENDETPVPEDSGPANADSRWVVGVDPDISGALAVLKPDNSAQVYDSPQLRVLVGKSVRKRLDVKSIIQSTTTTTPTTIEPETIPEPSSSKKSRSNGSGARVKKAVIDGQQLKLNWLGSLSYPRSENDGTPAPEDSGPANADSRWVVGVDPDISGALAVLKPDNSAQVYDSPHLRVLVGKSVRKRLDVKSMIQLLQKVDAPSGTTVYIEQSNPYPNDGKQGWWSGGFGYGLWIGILVASGYSVVPVPSSLWKRRFKLTGSLSSKDDSRELARTLFPSMSSLLKRKKDHGRAEALLIAAHGKGLKVDPYWEYLGGLL